MGFDFPYFFNYPPYFTLQPVQETRDKQSNLWQGLILQYCRTCKVYILSTAAEDDEPLFVNRSIDSAPRLQFNSNQNRIPADFSRCIRVKLGIADAGRLNHEGRTFFLDELVAQGRAAWLDKGKGRAMILWKTHAEWADTIYSWASGFGLNDSVLTVDELSSGDDVESTELEGLPREIIVPALKILESRGLARLFKGATPGEEGVKFLSR